MPGLAYLIDCSPMQRTFVDRKLAGDSDCEAARVAGYSDPEVQGFQVANSVGVRRALAESVAVLPENFVRDGLIANLQRAMQAVPHVDKDGNPDGTYTYEGHVANRALELIGKLKGIDAFIDKRTIIGDATQPIRLIIERIVTTAIEGEVEDDLALPPGCAEGEVVEGEE